MKEKKNNKKKIIATLIIGAVILSLIVIGGKLWFFREEKTEDGNTVVKSEQLSPEEAAKAMEDPDQYLKGKATELELPEDEQTSEPTEDATETVTTEASANGGTTCLSQVSYLITGNASDKKADAGEESTSAGTTNENGTSNGNNGKSNGDNNGNSNNTTTTASSSTGSSGNTGSTSSTGSTESTGSTGSTSSTSSTGSTESTGSTGSSSSTESSGSTSSSSGNKCPADLQAYIPDDTEFLSIEHLTNGNSYVTCTDGTRFLVKDYPGNPYYQAKLKEEEEKKNTETSTTSTETTTKACTHKWVWATHTETVHHDAVYETHYVRVIVEEHDNPIWASTWECHGCDFWTFDKNDMSEHALSTHHGYGSGGQKQTGEYEHINEKTIDTTDPTYYDDCRLKKTYDVLVEEAYDETITVKDYKYCSLCGEKK